MSELGYTTTILTVLGRIDNQIYRASNVSDKLKVHLIPNPLVKSLNVSNAKYMVNKLFNCFVPDCRIEGGSIVIDSLGLPSWYIKELQSKGCKVILNHAGSVKAYVNYFMKTKPGCLKSYLSHMKLYDRVLFQSQSQAFELDALLSKGEERSVLIRPSVSESDIRASKKESSSLFENNKVNITVVGSVQRRKGQNHLIEIAQSLSRKGCEYKIHVVGNILEQDFYDQLINSITVNGLSENIIFHGFQSSYLRYMNDSDIILQVSKEEGVSRILREAMALGKAIVSFRLDGTADLLEEDFDCMLAEPEQVDDIAKKLYELINNKAQRITLGKNAQFNFDEKYSYDSYSKQVNKLIGSMLGK